MPALGLKLRLNRISARILSVITTNLQLWSKMILSPYTGGARILDASTAGNNGDAYTGRTMSFDGVNDVITIGNTGQSVRTVVMWVYPSTTTQSFCQLTASGGVDLKITSGTLSGSGWTSPTYYVNGAAGSTGITANVWRMVAVTSATAVTASDVRLGLDNTTYYGGRLSNVIFYNVELSAAQIAELYAYPEKPMPTGVTAANVVGWWPLAESVGSLIAFDGSGNNNNGTISGATDSLGQNGAVPQWGFVGNNWPMFHDGSNDYVAANSVIPTTNFSVSFWIIANRVNSDIFFWATSTNTGRFRIVINASLGRLEVSDGVNEQYFSPNSAFVLQKIYHIVITMNTTTRASNMYINGSLSATYTFTDFNWGTVASSNYEIGRNNPSVPFGGVVFNHGVYDSILSANEVSALYSAGINHDLRTSTGNYTSTANLKGYWVNTGNQNTDWLDLSGNGNNGTVNGSPGRVFLPEGETPGKDILGMNLAHPVNGEMFVAASGYVQMNDAASLDLSSALTVEMWVKPNILATNVYVLHKGNSYRVYLGATGTFNLELWTGGVATETPSNASAITVGAWNHIVITYDGSNVRHYINGTLNKTTARTGTIDNVADTLKISMTALLMQEGYIDDVRIYSSVLTAAQILNNYKATKAAHS